MKPQEFNNNFYPTPINMAVKMVRKIVGHPNSILEPSAGKGNLIDYMIKSKYDRYNKPDISCIEIDKDLRAILRANEHKVIDSDFLSFSGPDKFDLIIANPPFDRGAEHLMKAIDILYSGQIIFLLNAETLKNPCNNVRKTLVAELKRLNAEIEYHEGEFRDAERKTNVEVALVNIIVSRQIELDLFAGANDNARNHEVNIDENHELVTGKKVADLVLEYNQIVTISTETILAYYRNYRKIGKYVGLNQERNSRHSSAYDPKSKLTVQVQNTVNETIRAIRKDFWLRTLELKEVKSRMTAKLQAQFETDIQQRSVMDFTESNIRAFILNLIHGFDDLLTSAVLEIFNMFTIKYAWDESFFTENTHYFNGWKTNDAFKVNKKVIIPVHGGHWGQGPFIGMNGEWKLDWDVERKLRDIDIVMNYFDGKSDYQSVTQALAASFDKGKNRGVDSTYFTITAYKKGTLHLTFKDENILRRFNVAACLGKGWLPFEYGNKTYNEMGTSERAVVESFEGKKSYEENIGQKLFATAMPSLPMLMAA